MGRRPVRVDGGPNEVVVPFEWASETEAREFVDAPVLQETLEKVRVQSRDASFLDHVNEFDV